MTDIPDAWHPRSAVDRVHTADEWRARIDTAFPHTATAKQPAVLVFPVLDQHSTIRPDGPALSLLAAHAATYSPEKRLALIPASVQRVLSEADCWAAGVRLERDQIRLCLRACAAQIYVLPRLSLLSGTPGQLELTVEIYGEDGRELDTTKHHRLTPAQVLRAPGLIAKTLLEHLGIQLSGRDADAMLTPRLQTSADAALLSGLLAKAPEPNDDALVAFLTDNPGCVPAWEQYLVTTDEPSVAGTRLQTVEPPLNSPALALAAALRLADIGRPEDGLATLLDLAPSHAGDPTYHKTLLRCAIRLDDAAVVRRLLDVWTVLDPSYKGCLGRGECLLDWAGSSEADGPKSTTPSRRARLQEAQAELGRAIALNSDDWIARSLLPDVAAGLDLPLEFVEQHFAAATRCRPQYRDAYVRKLDYLLRQSGRYPGRFLAFARECIETQRWKQRIPQAVWEVVYRACHDARNHATRYSALQSSELWDAFRLYHDSLQAGPVSATEKETTAKYYAWWGAYSGHDADAFDAFWKIRIDFNDNYFADQVLGSGSAYAFVADLLDAHAGYGNFQHLAAAYVAMSLGDLDQVDANLRRLQPDPLMKSVHPRIERLHRVVAQARRLRAERAIDYSPEPLKEALLSWSTEGPWGHRWTPQDGKLVWKTHGMLNADDTLLPFGLGHATISGVLEWTEGIETLDVVAHTRAARDRITMSYDVRNGLVRLVRNGKTLGTAKLAAGPQRFRLEYGAEQDLLQPCEGVVWQAAVLDDVPSGFGLRIVAPNWKPPPAQVALSHLRIELRD